MLNEILRVKQQEIKELRKELNPHEHWEAGAVPSFIDSLTSGANQLALIAEIKKASPSKGDFLNNYDPYTLAEIYAANGAAALSVITDKNFFKGNNLFIPEICSKVQLPILRKDFIIDEIQLIQTRQLGASAVLLIATVLEYPELLYLVGKCFDLGLEPLVEIHDKVDLKKALDTPARVIGVNNRNLKDFTVDLRTSIDLGPLIPSNRLAISESGISKTEDLMILKNCGFQAILVGEALVTSADIACQTRQLANLFNGE
ncbi:MAG: indole-3-glycerol phosphate synthase TrpC [Chitinophagales bacterium]